MTANYLSLVTGCVDSEPQYSTSSCHYDGGQQLSLHGLWFSQLCGPSISRDSSSLFISNEHQNQQNTLAIDSSLCTAYFRDHYNIKIGSFTCPSPVIVSSFVINCTMGPGTGTQLIASIELKQTVGDRMKGTVVSKIEAAVSYKEHVNLRDKFSRFTEYGVGGLRREIDELYRRAFASRGVKIIAVLIPN